MDKIDDIYGKLRKIETDKNRDEMRDIVLLDGAIVDENEDNKNRVYEDVYSRYQGYLTKLRYDVVLNKVEDKLEKYVEEEKKDINTKIGLLKMFVIRIAALKITDNKDVRSILEKLEKEDKIKEVRLCLKDLDDELL